MWKRNESLRPIEPTTTQPEPPPPTMRPQAPISLPTRTLDSGRAHLGPSIAIKGELTGSEDLTIEGRVEGKIELRQHTLTIGANGQVKAQVFAKSVLVLGQVTGNIAATDKVEIREHGSVEGDITSPRVAVAEGADFRGSIDMQGAAKHAQAKLAAANADGSNAAPPLALNGVTPVAFVSASQPAVAPAPAAAP